MTDPVVRELAEHGLTETAKWVAGRNRGTDVEITPATIDLDDLQRRLDAALRERDAHAAEVRRLREEVGGRMEDFKRLRTTTTELEKALVDLVLTYGHLLEVIDTIPQWVAQSIRARLRPKP